MAASSWGPFSRSDLERIQRLAMEDADDWKAYRRAYARQHRDWRATPEHLDTMGAAQERIVHDRRIAIKIQLCMESM